MQLLFPRDRPLSGLDESCWFDDPRDPKRPNYDHIIAECGGLTPEEYGDMEGEAGRQFVRKACRVRAKALRQVIKHISMDSKELKRLYTYFTNAIPSLTILNLHNLLY